LGKVEQVVSRRCLDAACDALSSHNPEPNSTTLELVGCWRKIAFTLIDLGPRANGRRKLVLTPVFANCLDMPLYNSFHGSDVGADSTAIGDVVIVGDFDALLFGLTRRCCIWPSI
jgi:hypothetical protein